MEILNSATIPENPPDTVEELTLLRQCCLACSACALRRGCKQVVFDRGNPRARIMLVGEGPGAEEDRLGVPFVGAAGRLLNRILEAVELNEDALYVTNVVKCRPPGNRLPEPAEVERCLPYLKKQIELVNPDIIVCLGSLAAKTLVDRKSTITSMRGRWIVLEGRHFMPTFHPAALLRDAGKKRPVWEDFQVIAQHYRSLHTGEGGV
ncbi:MAG: uracil-DNA glycosylase [Dethiobacter sp.]|nr:uracil-DNA glycosylase [Dethiobacter sp.]